MSTLKLSVVTPVYNEELGIAHFHECTRKVLESIPDVDGSIVYAVDRCTDRTLEVLRQIVIRDGKSTIIALSSRFGHQESLLAGIEYSLESDAIVLMDCDLQHPPELIPKMIEQFRLGYDVVFTTRIENLGTGRIRRLMGNLFYRFLSKICEVQINNNSPDFRLISRRVGAILTQEIHERNVFLRGLFSWIGFKQSGIEFVAGKRFAGEAKFSMSRLIRLATQGILSFTTKPLQIGIFAGVGFAALAFLFLLGAVINYFVDRTIPTGWTTLVTLLLLFSGVQLIVLGIMGSYIGGIYEEVKRRPRYIIDEIISSKIK
jgi:dolichol-phosphate mannosyltransferase